MSIYRYKPSHHGVIHLNVLSLQTLSEKCSYRRTNLRCRSLIGPWGASLTNTRRDAAAAKMLDLTQPHGRVLPLVRTSLVEESASRITVEVVLAMQDEQCETKEEDKYKLYCCRNRSERNHGDNSRYGEGGEASSNKVEKESECHKAESNVVHDT